MEKKVLVSANEFFKEAVDSAFEQRRLETFPFTKHYIVSLLESFIKTEQLFDQEGENGKRSQQPLAEMFLSATQPENSAVRVDLLKKLGDTSLYVSGFFGESLQRKVVDIDYYANMGELAYGSLTHVVREDNYRKVYQEFAERFMAFVDVLTLVSQKMMVQSNSNILRLYENYLKTGSELAKETLLEKGIHLPTDKKSSNSKH